MREGRISVIVPVHNNARSLEAALISIKNQSHKNFEVIVTDDGSTDDSPRIALKYADQVIRNATNMGPAISRNCAIQSAHSPLLAFTDSDCVAHKDWLKHIVEALETPGIDAIAGNTKIMHSTYLGDSISALGLPGGANAGFEIMWKVKQNGCTDHFSGCNFAARKETFLRFGLFDESFHLGGEDSELCRRWHLSGAKIKYCPHVLIYHEPRQDFDTFIKWMFYRGRSNYYLKKKIGDVSGLIGVRARSTLRIIIKNLFDAKLPMIIVLHAFSFAVQQMGYFYEKGRESK